MRFILNFFVFGFLFYLISIFFPDAFNTLVSWAASVYEFFHQIVMRIVEQFSEKKVADADIPQTLSALLPLAGIRIR